jgi:uncharacterized membrane protein
MNTNTNAWLGAPENPKTAAVVCYITLIGWLIAYFALYRNNKTDFAAFHLRQTLLLYLLLFALNIVGFWTTIGFMEVVNTVWFLLWLWGFIAAVYEKEKPVPFIGKIAQDLFKSL